MRKLNLETMKSCWQIVHQQGDGQQGKWGKHELVHVGMRCQVPFKEKIFRL
jgi:hypothetical protein